MHRQCELQSDLSAGRRELMERTRQLFEATGEIEAARRNTADQSTEELLIARRRADDLTTELATERTERKQVERELAELRSQTLRPTQPDVRLAGEAEAVIRLTQRALVGWAAESLRWTATELQALQAGVHTEAYRRATEV